MSSAGIATFNDIDGIAERHLLYRVYKNGLGKTDGIFCSPIDL
jgi:hypothetical protein